MKRRLILARALMHRPRLLILDEPTAGVDVELRLELWHYVQRINAEGTTILLTTHYLEEADQLCDRIAFINAGRDRGQRLEQRARRDVRRGQPRGRLPRAGRAQRALARPRRKSTRRDRPPDPLRGADAPRGQPLHEDQAPDGRRAAAGDLPLHLGLRRRAGLAHRQAPRLRLRRVHRARPDHDGLGDQRVLQQRLVDPPAEVPARDRRPALLAGVADRAAAGLLAGRPAARRPGGDADLRRRVLARRHPDRAPAGPVPGAAARRLLLRAARRAGRRARRAVRRRLLLPDVHPPAADLPRRRLLLGHAAAPAVRDADEVRPRLLHDRPGPLRVPGLLGHQRRARRSRC